MGDRHTEERDIFTERPPLNEIKNVFLTDMLTPRQMIITMSPGQWDYLLEIAYDEYAFLVEVDDNELPVAVYQKQNG